MSAAQLRSITEMAPILPFLCVNRSPIWYGFHASDASAIRYSVNYTIGASLVTVNRLEVKNNLLSMCNKMVTSEIRE